MELKVTSRTWKDSEKRKGMDGGGGPDLIGNFPKFFRIKIVTPPHRIFINVDCINFIQSFPT